jgi:large subunit ribosomal protein L24e
MAFCTFCNNQIPKGTGEIYVLRDGTMLNFCSSKCKVNSIDNKREGRLMKWTSKQEVLSSERKEEKKESAFAKDVDAKLKEKEAAKKAADAKK